MSAKDKYHEHVKDALIKDGWEITHDPYRLDLGKFSYEIDLGAEKLIGAEKEHQKIIVEVKSFLRESIVSEHHIVVGQYINYRIHLRDSDVERVLFLAISMDAYERLKELPPLLKSFDECMIKFIIVDVDSRKIVTWKK